MSPPQNFPLAWDSIDWVLLDMDGTLLDLHFDSYFWKQHLPKRYSELHQVELDTIRPQIHRQLEEKQGTLDWYCTQYWSKVFNLDIIAAKTELRHLICERPQAQEFLSYIGDLGKPRVLVTNADRPGIGLKFSATTLESQLDLVISSHDYGIPKEQAEFWHKLQRKIPFDPQRTLFIDDSESVLSAASGFGIKYVYAIGQADSTQPRLQSSQFPIIDDFMQLVDLDHEWGRTNG